MGRDEAAKKLRQVRLMRNPEELKEFEAAFAALLEIGGPAVVDDMFAAFDDATGQHEVMWNLVHALEDYEDNVYLPALMFWTPRLLPHAREWAGYLHERVLASSKSLPPYLDRLSSLSPEAKQAVQSLLEDVERRKPKLKRQIQRARRKLG